jgi:hypothetical protein
MLLMNKNPVFLVWIYSPIEKTLLPESFHDSFEDAMVALGNKGGEIEVREFKSDTKRGVSEYNV